MFRSRSAVGPACLLGALALLACARGGGGVAPAEWSFVAPAPAPMAPAVRDPLPPCRRERPVADGAALGAALASAQPGDCLLVADGVYEGITIRAQGAATAPLVVRAARRGGATFTGRVKLVGASAVVVEGFVFTGASGVTITDGHDNRITRGRFRLDPGTMILVNGNSRGNRIDHNELGPLARGHFIQPTGMSERTWIDHNHLHDLADCGGNGCESISLGCCGPVADAHETFNVVEHNLFVNCDGESEMIGMKSSRNTVRYNTIRRSRGQISFRAGRNNSVYGNYILGEGKPDAQGIRLLDEGHLVYDNYVDVTGFPLRVQHGEAPGFPPVRRARIVHNTFVVRGAPLELGGTGHKVAPAESLFANNLVLGTGPLISEKGGGIKLAGNVVSGAPGVSRPVGEIRQVDVAVTRVGELLKAEVGGQEKVGAAPGRGPLTVNDVGVDAP